MKVTTVATLRTEGGEAGTRQAADAAPQGGGVTEDTPRTFHRLAAVPAVPGDDGRVVVTLLAAGQTLQHLRAGPEHLPPVQEVSVGLHVGVVELVVV